MTGRATGRFPGFDVLSQSRHWDAVTADLVTARTGPPPQPRFFTDAEQASAAALLNQLTGQCDEPLGVPVLEMVDARLAAGETDGWRYADLPEDGQAWRDTLGYLDKDAQARCGTGFADAPERDQAAIIQAVQDGQRMARAARAARVEPVDPVRLHGPVLPSARLVRDGLPRPGLPARLQERGRRQAGALRGRATRGRPRTPSGMTPDGRRPRA